MNEQEAIKELNVYVSDEHKLTLSKECIDLARNALEKQISLERILERLKKEKRDFNYENIDNWNMSRKEKEMYEDGVNKAIEIVKEEGSINA